MKEETEERKTDENTGRQYIIEADKAKAIEMRKRAMESIWNQKKDKESEKAKKKRRSSSDGMVA